MFSGIFENNSFAAHAAPRRRRPKLTARRRRHHDVGARLYPSHLSSRILQPSYIHPWNGLPPEFRPFLLPPPSLSIASHHLHSTSISIISPLELSTQN